MWKLREFSHLHFWQKFRESNGFANLKQLQLLKSWFDEISLGEREFLVFPLYIEISEQVDFMEFLNNIGKLEFFDFASTWFDEKITVTRQERHN